jgi:hypothetical protein
MDEAVARIDRGAAGPLRSALRHNPAAQICRWWSPRFLFGRNERPLSCIAPP